MTTTSPTKYWIVVASKDHVQNGIAAGIAQAGHGKSAPLKRMHPGDYIIYYSGKLIFGKLDKCQEFTAIGKIKDKDIYEVQLSPDFSAFRRDVEFFPHHDISILPLIDQLEFIQNKKSWGYPFRTGSFEINQHDFDLISGHMLIKNKKG